MYSNKTIYCIIKHICIQYESIPIKQWKERKLRSVFDVETGYVVKWSPFFVRHTTFGVTRRAFPFGDTTFGVPSSCGTQPSECLHWNQCILFKQKWKKALPPPSSRFLVPALPCAFSQTISCAVARSLRLDLVATSNPPYISKIHCTSRILHHCFFTIHSLWLTRSLFTHSAPYVASFMASLRLSLTPPSAFPLISFPHVTSFAPTWTRHPPERASLRSLSLRRMCSFEEGTQLHFPPSFSFLFSLPFSKATLN